VATGRPLAANGVSAVVLSLADTALKTAGLGKVVLLVALLALGTLAAGVGPWPTRPNDDKVTGWHGDKATEDMEVTAPHLVTLSPPHPVTEPRVDPFGDALPAGAVARLGTLRLRHGAAVDVLAFSPDGRLLAASSRDGALSLWDTATGKEVRRLSGEYHQITALAFSLEGRFLACAEAGRPVVRLWDIEAGKERPALRGHTGSVRKVAFGPGNALVSAGSDGTLRLWDVQTSREVRQLGVLGRETGTFALAPDGKTLAWCGPAADVRLWDLPRGIPLRVLAEPPARVDHLDFSPDGTRLLARDARGTGCCWEVSTGLLRSRRSADASVRVPLAADGPFVLSLHPDGRLGLTDCLSNKDLCTLQGLVNGLSSFTVSADRQSVALGSLEGAITLWDVGSGLEVMPLEGHQGRVALAGFTPDGRQLITAGTDHCLRLWDPQTGLPLGRIDGVDGPCALSPDARLLAEAGSDNQVRLWDLATARPVALCERQPGLRGVTGLAFSPNGRVLAAAVAANPFGRDGDPAVCLWKVATSGSLTVLPWRPGLGRTSVTFAPDGKGLVTADGDAVRLWDPGSGIECWSLRNFSGRGGSVAFAPDGTLLAVADHGNNTVRLCRTLTGEVVAQFEFPAESASGVLALAFSPDGKLLAASGADGTVRLCETSTLRQRSCYRGHRAPVETLAFSPDGCLLVSGSRDTTVLVWTIRPPHPAKAGPHGK
jgi:WD40 repeat protein